ncbi:type I-C CRISPR-associated protein Cas5c [Sinanaerobacter sp. ZZT-01]|uniref:type I-C CRISPR-associated protein Cas5c n=1 Tax=Sinanaerobacter sp. ZZT-01 TaxID=3111540 RepID=UPI002D789C04|nr:type I-C CRISPR-associated protein Cas5c [Sinanaerobacter sp. ZZT-01]WRR92481.1 type I-C CRISPR-associated protein Cas5c [Sinanaerobacter sp. ZZT-01]
MGYGVRVEVWGDYALFTRPEMKTERVSYDVMTASAARGILESIYWHPGLKWVIDRIYVLKEIQFTNIRRNEVKSKLSSRNAHTVMNGAKNELAMYTSEEIQQRASLILKDVHYVIEAHFELTDQAGERDSREKFYAIASRRLRNGQCYSQPYFGCREFPVQFRLCEAEDIETAYSNEERDLGFVLYDMDYSNLQDIQPMFVRTVMKNGVIDFSDCEVFR